MKPVLFCSFLLAFLSFACKPKPLDNLKEVAKQAEENKVFRVSRERFASETRRVADSVLTLIIADQKKLLAQNPKDTAACNFAMLQPYQEFQKKYNARLALISGKTEIMKLEQEMEELRKYRNELSIPVPGNKFPATFQTLNDSLLYVRPAKVEEVFCAGAAPESGFWVFKFPKKRFVEILTIKVKPKPAKGPNW
jgi:hypothetical protein